MNDALAVSGWDAAAIAFAVWALIMAALPAIDGRRLDGENTWSKPFKFAVSLVVHFATFAVIARFLPTPIRGGAALATAFVVAATAAGLAQGYITVQAARRRRSHFNAATRLEAAMLGVTGLCALLVLAPAVVVGVDAVSAPLPGWTAAARAGLAIGLLAGALLTTLTGFRMGGNGGHFVGRPSKRPRLMRLTGWSLDNPDLRPAHFLANHMMQVVPAAGALAGTALSTVPALCATVALACGWAWVTLAALRAAKAHRPLPHAFALLA